MQPRVRVARRVDPAAAELLRRDCEVDPAAAELLRRDCEVDDENTVDGLTPREA
jgi:hypothetical protein